MECFCRGERFVFILKSAKAPASPAHSKAGFARAIGLLFRFPLQGRAAGEALGGGQAVGLFNLSDQPSYIEVNYAQLGVKAAVKTRDVWAAKDLGKLKAYRALVMPHGVVLLRLGA